MSDQTTGWIRPSNPDAAADYWVTRRDADAELGYSLTGPDVKVCYRWMPDRQAWLTGYHEGIQRREAEFSLLHSNNGWRIEGPVAAASTEAEPYPGWRRAFSAAIRERSAKETEL